MTYSRYEIRICENPTCGLRYPLVEGHPFGIRCPLCLGSTQVVLTRPLSPEPFLPFNEPLPARNKRLHAVLDNVRSAWNVGAMFRTADGLGVEKLYLCGITPTPENDAVRKTSLGAEESVQWEYARDAVKLAERLKAEGFTLWGLEQDERAVRLGSGTDEAEKRIDGTDVETKKRSLTTDEAEKRIDGTDVETKKRSLTTDEAEKQIDGTDVETKKRSLTTDEAEKQIDGTDVETKKRSLTTDEAEKRIDGTDVETKKRSLTTDEAEKRIDGTDVETKKRSLTTDEAEKRIDGTDVETKKRSLTTDETEKRDSTTKITDKRIALVVGNEVTGVDPGLLESCDQILYIPMRGGKRSLNVEVAFAIAAWVINED